MNFLTLAEIKMQARVDNDYDDALLTTFGEAAESKIYSDTGYSYAELLAMSIERNGGSTIDAKLKMAGLMLVSNWYEVRNAGTKFQMYVVPYAYEALIADYVCHTFPSDDDSDGESTTTEE